MIFDTERFPAIVVDHGLSTNTDIAFELKTVSVTHHLDPSQVINHSAIVAHALSTISGPLFFMVILMIGFAVTDT